jgi:hypothetical protein
VEAMRRYAHSDGEHPLIYVAPFSHACYFEDGAHPYLGGIDNPDGSRPAIMPQIEELGAWKRWPGRWGNSAGVLAPISKGRLGGRSPASPARQGKRWTDPLDYHRDGEKIGIWRKLGRGIRLAGKATYPTLTALSAELDGQTLTVDYELDRSPLRPASQLYVTAHHPPAPGAPQGAVGEILVSHSKEIERRRASVALLLPMPLEQCLVVASALNAARQRSDPLRATAT